eukprot:16955-Hanusia_phi.AAC.2
MSSRLLLSCGGATLLTSLVPDKRPNQLGDRRRGRESCCVPVSSRQMCTSTSRRSTTRALSAGIRSASTTSSQLASSTGWSCDAQ